MAGTETTVNVDTTEKPRRMRRYRKRTKLKHVPRALWPVRALWEAASEEDRTRAHATTTAMLELWLGKAQKQEVAERLGVPPIRLWQLSQQALAGMAAGLLVQPKRRPRGKPELEDPSADGRALRKRNAEIEQENRQLKELLALFRELPGNRTRATHGEAKPESEALEDAPAPSFRGRRNRAASTRTAKIRRLRASPSRNRDPGGSDSSPKPTKSGDDARSEPAHAPVVGGEGRETTRT